MNADEIVRIDEAVNALHRLSVLLVTPDSIVCCEAADLIESLQAQLAIKTMELSDLRETIRIKGGTEHAPTEYAFFTACAVVRKLHAQLSEKTALLDATIAGQETLQRALAASQHRERAAVEDLETIVESGSECNVCKHRVGVCGCPIRYTGCVFIWRGPRDAGEGEAE